MKKLDISIEEKLEALFQLQSIDSQIDKINFIKGELPLEVQEMNDSIIGLNTRIANIKAEVDEVEAEIQNRSRIKEESKNLITKLEKQQSSVKNNREFESISKELELAKLEIELCDKKMRDGNEKKNGLTQRLDAAVNDLNLKNEEIAIKKKELEQIELETDKELETLTAQSEAAKVNVEDRYLIAYERIRKAYRNGLAVVTIDRDSCGGCFAKVPPQRQLEVKQRKKIIVCENCGRIFVYPKSKEVEDMNKEVEEAPKVVRSRSKRVRGE